MKPRFYLFDFTELYDFYGIFKHSFFHSLKLSKNVTTIVGYLRYFKLRGMIFITLFSSPFWNHANIIINRHNHFSLRKLISSTQ